MLPRYVLRRSVVISEEMSQGLCCRGGQKQPVQLDAKSEPHEPGLRLAMGAVS